MKRIWLWLLLYVAAIAAGRLIAEAFGIDTVDVTTGTYVSFLSALPVAGAHLYYEKIRPHK